MVQVWYPIKPGIRTKNAPYLIYPGLHSAMKTEKYLDLATNILNDWQKLSTHSQLNAPLTTTQHHLPVVFFSPGYGVSHVNYTAYLEEIASHGYLVLAIDHPYAGLTILPDGKAISPHNEPSKSTPVTRVSQMAQDASFVLTALQDAHSSIGQFWSHIDIQRVGIFGHSLGGATALEIGRMDKRFRACVDLDGDTWGKVDEEGVRQPFMVLLNEPGAPMKVSPQMRKERDDQWKSISSKSTTPPWIIKIHDFTHFSFSDLPFLVPKALLNKSGGNLPAPRGHNIVTKLLLAFFSEYLGGKSGEMQQALPAFKEIHQLKFGSAL